MEIEQPSDFQEFLKLLKGRGIKYLVTGGYAVAYHGYPLATKDLDVWIAVSPENARRMVNALREFGFSSIGLDENLFLRDKIVRMGMPPIRIEITTAISGVEFYECYRERVVDEIGGVKANLIDLRHLKLNKKASGGSKDLVDLENLP